MTFSFFLRIIGKTLTFALYLITLLAAFGGYIPPTLWSLPAIFVLAFPYLLILTFIVALAWLIGGRMFIAIAGAVTILIAWPVSGSSCPVSFSTEPKKSSFSLLTYNVFDLQNYEHPDDEGDSRALSYIISSKADIVCLQELYNLPHMRTQLHAQSDSLRHIYPYIIPGKPWQGYYTPFMLLSKYPAVECEIPKSLWTDCALYKIRLPNMVIHLLNVHLTSYALSQKERKIVSNIRGFRSAKQSMQMDKSVYAKLSAAFASRDTLSHAIRQIADSIQGPLIIAGDFNDVPASYAYRTICGDDFKDAVAKTTFGPMITYHAHGFLFHIDQVLYRGKLTPNSTKRGSLKCSDHYPVRVIFSY